MYYGGEPIENNNSLIDTDIAVQQRIETNGKVSSGNIIDYHAGEEILLLPDFEVELGGAFHAYILPCE